VSMDVCSDQRTSGRAGQDRSAYPGPATKAFRQGTHRLVPPEETLARVQPLMLAMGITRIANITGLDVIGLPVVMACRPNSRSLAVSQGKGLTLVAAKASGLMESVEAYHAERITLPLKLGSCEELSSTHQLVDVTGLPRTTTSRFHPGLRLLWVEGRDLLRDGPVWVPYEVVHIDFTPECQIGGGCFVCSSNGLAAGNHVLEAISHGICEVVERDAASLWFLLSEEEKQRTRTDVEGVDDPLCREALERYERAGLSVAIWETTQDIRIPSFRCVVTEREHNPLHVLYSAEGYGCHPTRSIALLRAMTEAAQSRLTVIAGTRDDVLRSDYERFLNLDAFDRLRATIEVAAPMNSFRDGPGTDAATLDEDVAWELDRLRDAGSRQVVVIDLTKPEFELPVVRVVIPGLELSVPDCLLGVRARDRLGRRA